MFVQIGDLGAINSNHIESVWFSEEHITVHMATPNEDGVPTTYKFVGKEREAFLAWWENSASVYWAH